MVFIYKLSQSTLQVGQFEWSLPDLTHVKAIAVFITRVYLLRVCSTWQKPCSGKYVVAKPSNISFTFPES